MRSAEGEAAFERETGVEGDVRGVADKVPTLRLVSSLYPGVSVADTAGERDTEREAAAEEETDGERGALFVNVKTEDDVCESEGDDVDDGDLEGSDTVLRGVNDTVIPVEREGRGDVDAVSRVETVGSMCVGVNIVDNEAIGVTVDIGRRDAEVDFEIDDDAVSEKTPVAVR